jgi:hypothetical protein
MMLQRETAGTQARENPLRSAGLAQVGSIFGSNIAARLTQPPHNRKYDHVTTLTSLMGKNRANEKDHPRPELGKPTVSVLQAPGEGSDRSVAHAMRRPDVQASATLLCYNKGQPELTLDGLVAELSAQCEAASNGDLTRSEALLTAQAHTLDGLFNSLARRAQGAQYLGQMESFSDSR